MFGRLNTVDWTNAFVMYSVDFAADKVKLA